MPDMALPKPGEGARSTGTTALGRPNAPTAAGVVSITRSVRPGERDRMVDAVDRLEPDANEPFDDESFERPAPFPRQDRETVQPTFPVQRAKVQRPPLRADTLQRDRLLDWLSVNVHHRLVLLVAEAGYGKTTLLADFARQTHLRTMWFRVDEDDRDWISALNYLVAAGRELEPTFAEATAERLAQIGTIGGTRDEILKGFMADLAALGSEPTVLIVDDYHVLDESPDARSVVADILAKAPERFTVVLATRRRPILPVARLRAHGEVAELSTDDLRFTELETDALFRDAYQQPLDPDVLVDLARRTEGWAASLQLVRAACRERSSAQVRAFVRSLSGVDENLYDYLAEEVVGELEPAMQDFLMRTSILQVVDPALAEVVAGVPQPDGRRLIEAAERIGLLARRGEMARHTVRYHPLVRDFLEDRLRRDIGDDAVRDLHRSVARHGEHADWRLAAYHYAAASDIEDLHRVIRESLPELLGRGDIQVAHEYLTMFPMEGLDPLVDVINSRISYIENRNAAAYDSAVRAYDRLSTTSGPLRDSALFNLVSLQLEHGRVDETITNARLLSETGSDTELRSIAAAFLLSAEVLEPDVAELIDHLELMARRQSRSRLRYFYGVTLANAAYIYRQMGRPADATRSATLALDVLPSSSRSPVVSSAKSVLAWAAACRGALDEARALAREAIGTEHTLTRIESLVEAADVETWYGSIDRAAALLEEASRTPDAGLRGRYIAITKAELLVRQGRPDSAREIVANDRNASGAIPVGHLPRRLYIEALAAVVLGDVSAKERIETALGECTRRHVGLFGTALRVLSAISGTSLSGIETAAGEAVSPLSLVADAIVPALKTLNRTELAMVATEAHLRPERWASALRRGIEIGSSESALAANLLDEVGSKADVVLLRRYVRSARRAGVDQELGRRLARRLAPRVFVEDLGRVRIVVGGSEIPGTGVRRRALGLLCYLLTRPDWSATKDQVLEALWPESDPDVGANSLNQTLYFLRRVFDPSYKEDISAEYVHYEQDVMWLDRELVDSRSRTAVAEIDSAVAGPSAVDLGALLACYRGPFGLDFAYEEWAVTFRDALHIRFLEVVERVLSDAASHGNFGRAIVMARGALDVDPEADQLEALLIRLYRLSGSHVAAAEQYAHYSRVVKTALGVDPPPLEEL